MPVQMSLLTYLYHSAHKKETSMHKWTAPIKVFGYAVVLLVALAILYAAAITITHWSGISV